MNRKITLIIILCAVWLSDCRKTDTNHQVPNVRVNEYIVLSLPQYNTLNFINGWVYLDGGYNGLIAFRVTEEEIKVYDRQAPYYVKDKCQVIVDSNSNVSCIDTCSGSQWLLLDGQILKGPASQPLRFYQTSFDGTHLSITN
ncbi:hypothetical protein N9545_00925 [Salibacteraceae bacterium]|nr:hypothetical protein [Salibacteraceae bacterium]